jgi:hypothetical protein
VESNFSLDAQDPVVESMDSVYTSEKEQRLAEFVIAMDKMREDANGAASRKIRAQEIASLNTINTEFQSYYLTTIPG